MSYWLEVVIGCLVFCVALVLVFIWINKGQE